jgi:hypothetical protein
LFAAPEVQVGHDAGFRARITYNSTRLKRLGKEAAMTQSMIIFVVGLAVLLVLAFMLARRYMRNHKGDETIQWLDAHHMGWMHRKH